MDMTLAPKVAVAVVIYCLSVSAVPIYNKMVFSGTICWSDGCAKKFPYPIATAFLQLGFVSLLLTLANIIGYACSPQARSSGKSWIFGPHFGYKLRHVAPVGLLFGIKYGITNWGLALVPTAKHLLLQSTDLVWTVIFARIINKERLGLLEGVAASLSVAGAVCISLEGRQGGEVPALGLVVNLMTPIFLALCIAFLRTGTAEVFRKDNCLGGSMTPAEFTAMKLALSSTMALVLACLMENEAVLALEGKKEGEAWWTAAGQYPSGSWGLLLGGGLFVLIFQVNITWLAGLTSAIATGIVGEVKVVPQWMINALFNLKINLSPLNVSGAAFSLAGSILYACSASQASRLVLTRQGFQWQERALANTLGISSFEAQQRAALEEKLLESR